MIPFFRKIRKKMADDNRPLKYMRYAIGEIVLVVIGILIALQINNWNEEKKGKKNVKDILKLISYDLKSDLKVLDSVNMFKDSAKYHSEKYFEYLERKDLTIKDFFKVMNPDYHIFIDVRFHCSRRGYSVLTNSNLNATTNNSILDSVLFDYYEYAQIIEDQEQSMHKNINRLIIDVYGEIGTVPNITNFSQESLNSIHYTITEDQNYWFNSYKNHPKLSAAHLLYLDDLGLQNNYIKLKTKGHQILDMIYSIE